MYQHMRMAPARAVLLVIATARALTQKQFWARVEPVVAPLAAPDRLRAFASAHWGRIAGAPVRSALARGQAYRGGGFSPPTPPPPPLPWTGREGSSHDGSRAAGGHPLAEDRCAHTAAGTHTDSAASRWVALPPGPCPCCAAP